MPRCDDIEWISYNEVEALIYPDITTMELTMEMYCIVRGEREFNVKSSVGYYAGDGVFNIPEELMQFEVDNGISNRWIAFKRYSVFC